MLPAEWMVMLLFLVQSVPMVRLECTDGALLRAQCSSVSMVRSFLLHESQSGSVRIRCGHSATSYSWSKSDDGSAANAVILDTSSDKYTIVDDNSLDIRLDNVTGVDGGLYRCVYGEVGTSLQLCIYVYATISPPVTPPAPVGVQALCSVVVWYSPEVTCEDTISGYEMQFYDLNFTQSNVTRYIGANKTFYGITEEDKLAGDDTSVQIRVLYNSIVGQWSDGISIGCNLKRMTIFNVYFMLNGTVYLNNSAIPLLGVGEGDHALQCRTSRDECCKTLPNWFGDFYYPNRTQVFNEGSGYGFYRNRGQKVIHLNRREGVTSPTGKYRCEIPDADGEMKSIFINLIE